MAAPDEPLRCPRCGRRARVLDLTASSITCSDCDPAFEAVRHGVHPPFGVDAGVDAAEPADDEDQRI